MSSQRGAQLMSELLPEPTPLRLTGPPGSLRPSRDGGGRSADSAEIRTDFKQLLMLLRRRIGFVAGHAAPLPVLVPPFRRPGPPRYPSPPPARPAPPPPPPPRRGGRPSAKGP